ncbi:bifunctional anthranilate synthase component I family protein/aminotransferase class IV [Neisseria sp. ZJ106]|uniref:Bifunctional anthranilate synthase component I family protein/class IV aminotransferase n=1 Tax=Neisseria lisongii TaxID=2912188 RepID=A0ABY7RJ24_9NEIS|nr:bifunctional anthranilate synthase component I family protein/class IV aminotransferase [Neisseria lisongii]MCF7521886.1 bifunctional anthranilate synthase component I family protein/aminotransferase class IV [Neisseria lisongii]WCL71627.1 bifunctional anthranilate synthase component I family protein/class IV aminotransferase [Neisseria lisongii]
MYNENICSKAASFFAVFDDAVSGRTKCYQNHKDSRFLTADSLHLLDNVLQQGWQSGLHAVLCADYTFGQALMGMPSENASGVLAVHWFADCAEVDIEDWLNQFSDGLAGISTPQSSTNEADYLAAVAAVHDAIRRGDTYQINYTTRLHFDTYGSPIALYRRLRQPVPYAALTCLPDQNGATGWTLCFSPELFLKIHSDGQITTEPMKGTAPILHDGLDEQRAEILQSNPKNRAENIMIVDLLRNDLGKISQTGSVRVPEPLKVSRFGSVWQMTSTISAQAQPQTGAADIFRAAFPCGSITGAPKRMSMQIIQALESEARGLYTGSIGYLNPCGSGLGFEGVLNVVIRTLSLTPTERADVYHGVYGVGSGIVIDSDPQGEYQECGWKARFLTELAPPFGIFETLNVRNRQCRLLHRHLGRLKTAAHALNLRLPSDYVQQIEHYLAAMPSENSRLKISLNSDGLSFSHAPIQPVSGIQNLLLSPNALPVCDYLRRFKTDRRAAFDAAWQTAEQHGAFDSLLFNTDGVLLEGGRSSVFVKINGQWHTPALDLDILNGVMRQEILDNPQHYLGADSVAESRISADMLANAEHICISNALRGVMEARIIRPET